VSYIDDIIKSKRDALKKSGSPLFIEFNDDYFSNGFISLYFYFDPDNISIKGLKEGCYLFFEEVFINNNKKRCCSEKDLDDEERKYKLKISTRIKSWLLKKIVN
jgi:hypothetical protein